MYNSKEILTDFQCFCPSFERQRKYVTGYFYFFFLKTSGKYNRVFCEETEKIKEIKWRGEKLQGQKNDPSHNKNGGKKKIIVDAEKNHYEMRQRRGKE